MYVGECLCVCVCLCVCIGLNCVFSTWDVIWNIFSKQLRIQSHTHTLTCTHTHTHTHTCTHTHTYILLVLHHPWKQWQVQPLSLLWALQCASLHFDKHYWRHFSSYLQALYMNFCSFFRGILLAFCWYFAGILLAFCWHFAGILLAFCINFCMLFSRHSGRYLDGILKTFLHAFCKHNF